MKILFVVNPISGGVDKEPFLAKAKELCKKYNLDYHIFKTTGQNDDEELKKVLSKYQPDRVASVGGDGTTLFTAVNLLATEYPMGIIPLGSANGMATELFVNPKPIEALKDLIMSQYIEGLDLLRINDVHYTMHIGDVGVNAQIVASYENDPKRGMSTYAKYFLEELRKLKPFAVKVEANGEIIEENALMVAICNARKYGTGVPLNVQGNPMDGIFELVLITNINASSLIKAGLASFDESFLANQSDKVIATDYAEISFNEPHLLQLDGEVIEKVKKIKIEILKGAVNFITNGQNSNILNM